MIQFNRRDIQRLIKFANTSNFWFGVVLGSSVTVAISVAKDKQQPNLSMVKPKQIPDTIDKENTSLSISPQQVLKYGTPMPIHDATVNSGFVSLYDRRTKNPIWSAELMTADLVNKRSANRVNSVFVPDENIPKKYRTELADFFRSGYDRGHLTPAADLRWSQDAMDETFKLSNISPQVGQGFNRKYWNSLERFCRSLAYKYDTVRIFTGPLWLPRQTKDGKYFVSYQMIGDPPRIAVPTHFFKILICEKENNPNEPHVEAFVLPNEPIDDNTPLTKFIVPLEALEIATGVDFANKLPKTAKALCKNMECGLEKYTQKNSIANNLSKVTTNNPVVTSAAA